MVKVKGKKKKDRAARLKEKRGKEKPAKKEKKTGGFPEQVVLTKEKDGDLTYYAVHPVDFADINEDTMVGIFRFRRVVNVAVTRKIKRIPKE